MGSESSLPLDPFENEWIINWLTSPTMNYITWVLNILQIIMMPNLFMVYVYKLIKTNSWQSSKPSDDAQKKKSVFINNATHVITINCIIFSFISGIVALLNNTASISHYSSCVPVTMLLNITWLIAKCSIYNVTLLRLQSVFQGTVFQYNPYFFAFMYFIINSVFLVSFIGSFLDISSIHFADPGQPGWCLYIIPTYLIFLPASLDIFFTPIVIVLFIKPMKVLASIDDDQNQNIAKILTKYILLSSIAIFSNIFSSIFFGITDITFFNWFDVIINPLCLVLMQAYMFDVYYSAFCCKYCHNGLHKVLHEEKGVENIKMLEKGVEESRTTTNTNTNTNTTTGTTITTTHTGSNVTNTAVLH